MSETTEIPGGERPSGEARRRGRRHRRRPLLLRYWWILPLAALLAALPTVWNWIARPSLSHEPLPGYIADSSKVEEEYRELTGKPLEPTATRDFDDATKLMLAGNYGNAAILLESTAKQLPVPAVFNDIGVLYSKLKDGSRALKAFRDALARNHDYAPVRANLKQLHLAETLDPGANEMEPNNTIADANPVWLDRPVSGVVDSSVGDVDCYWFTTPKPPRDRISIVVESRSVTLTPRMRLLNESGNAMAGLKEATAPGGFLRYDLSPPPNTLYYVEVDGVSGSGGAYTLTVSPVRAYDVYEPNDTILAASRIAPGQDIEANIMDSEDTDFYAFQSSTARTVDIEVKCRENTLLLGLATFAPDLQNTGFAPDVKGPGASIHHTMQMEANQLYYVQVFGRENTTGPYSLLIK